MRSIRVLTADDETLALRRLKLLLRGMAFVEHVGEASSCAEALARTPELEPDVLLLDIKMRDGDGVDILQHLFRLPNPPIVIFVTAFDKFAIRAFEDGVADYLLKPVERDRLGQALHRARQKLHGIDAEQRVAELQTIVRNLRDTSSGENSAFETEFWLRSSSGTVRVPVDAIECVSSEDDYVAIHTRNGSLLMRGSIRQFEQRVEPGRFIRVHRRWLVRRSAIVELRSPKTGPAEILLRTGRRVPAGRVNVRALRRLF